MKIQCDVCEKAPATVICCADEAALCASCDVEIHAANKLASKHQRLLLQSLSNKLPRCDICQVRIWRFGDWVEWEEAERGSLGLSASTVLLKVIAWCILQPTPCLRAEQQEEKTAFIFCVEDRALFCRDCDEPTHVPGTLSGDHQRFLATGIRVALSSACNKDIEKGYSEPANHNSQLLAPKIPATQQNTSSFTPSAWAVDDFLQLSDYESGDKRGSPVGFGELEWFSDIGLFEEQRLKGGPEAAEVPEISMAQPSNASFYKPIKSSMPLKKPRLTLPEDEEYFTVPDLG